jgi:hypothetical protein
MPRRPYLLGNSLIGEFSVVGIALTTRLLQKDYKPTHGKSTLDPILYRFYMRLVAAV